MILSAIPNDNTKLLLLSLVKRVKQLRKEKGISIEEIAFKAYISAKPQKTRTRETRDANFNDETNC